MTDEQIIKAYEKCCIKKTCIDCPFYKGNDDSSCIKERRLATFDLLNRQKAEIERLKGWASLLKAEKHSLIEAEAIKKFAEKVISYCEYIIGEHWNTISAPASWADAYEGFIDDINNFVKEMVGED